VGDQATAVDIGELRAHLKQSLPDYMVPSAFAVLDTLPLTPNGKLDRRALPAPEMQTASSGYVAPRTAVEEILVQLWAELLGHEKIGTEDNFFELGGHSLLAMRLVAQVRKVLSVSLSLRFLFEEQPTIASMAAMIIATRAAEQGFEGQKESSRDYSCIIPIQLSCSNDSVLCIHPIGGGILCYRELAKSLGPQYSVYGIKAVGLHGEQDPLVSIEQMADHHVRRIFEIQEAGPFNLVGWSAGGLIAVAIADKLRKLGHAVGTLALIDTNPPSSGGEWRHNRRQVERTEWFTFMNIIEMPTSRKLASRWHSFWRLSDDEKMQYVLRLAKNQNALPKGMTEAEFRRLVAVFQANLHALQHFVVHPYDGRILLFQSEEGLSQHPRESRRAAQFWSSKALRGCELLYVKGNHGSMVASPTVETIADRLRQELGTPASLRNATTSRFEGKFG
jgi:thioesterase domain-containing protein/acyl carrier protein